MGSVSRASLTLALFMALGVPVRADEPMQLVPFRFLLGEWEGVGSGSPGGGSGRETFSRALQERVILRSTYSEYPAQAGRPASRHDDLMVIFVDADSTVRANYFDSEGHVIRYVAESPANGQAVFVSPSSQTAPRYRLTYRQGAGGTIAGTFEIAPPGKTDAFTTYLKWESRKADRGSGK